MLLHLLESTITAVTSIIYVLFLGFISLPYAWTKLSFEARFRVVALIVVTFLITCLVWKSGGGHSVLLYEDQSVLTWLKENEYQDNLSIFVKNGEILHLYYNI